MIVLLDVSQAKQLLLQTRKMMHAAKSRTKTKFWVLGNTTQKSDMLKNVNVETCRFDMLKRHTNSQHFFNIFRQCRLLKCKSAIFEALLPSDHGSNETSLALVSSGACEGQVA